MKHVIITRRIVNDLHYFDQNRSDKHNHYTLHSDDDHSLTKHVEGGSGFTCNTLIYVLPVDVRAARKFTGTWSSYRHHTAVSSPSYLGTSQKGKSHNLTKKNLSILFFSIICHNIYRFQARIYLML